MNGASTCGPLSTSCALLLKSRAGRDGHRVSESAGVRVFDGGTMVAETIQELWLLTYLDSALMPDYVWL